MTQQDLIDVEPRPACDLCGMPGETLYDDLEDHLFGVPGKWTFKKCTAVACGFIWLDPVPVPGDMGRTYRNYYTHGQSNMAQDTLMARIIQSILRPVSNSLLRVRDERKRYKIMFLDQVPIGRLLEVGCGNGRRLARMKALGWKVVGQEMDPVAAKHVREVRGIDVHLGLLETLPNCEEKFDAVIISHVIEHVRNPLALLTASYQRLKENGVLVVATPNAASYGHRKFGAFWRGLEPPRHLQLFTCKTLMQIAQSAGFNRINCQTTAVSSYGIGKGSQLPARTAGGSRVYTSVDVLRGLWFQLTAYQVLQKMKDSGEECVMMAFK